MLEGIQNGNDGKEEHPADKGPGDGTPATAEAGTEHVERLNQALIKDGVMVVNIYLEDSKSPFATAIGSLELAKDLVKNYFGKKMMSEAAAKARTTQKIVVPKLS